jgi:hypothetical protein
MKKASGLIMLLLAALLVAMPAAAVTPGVANGADASMLGAKITLQEEVGGVLAAESMAALAVDPNEAQVVSALPMMISESDVRGLCYVADHNMSDSYKSTPGAGGDGLLARRY